MARSAEDGGRETPLWVWLIIAIVAVGSLNIGVLQFVSRDDDKAAQGPVGPSGTTDKSGPAIAITHPTDLAVSYESPLAFQGTTDVGATVSVAGIDAEVDEFGQWSVDVELKRGQNTLLFTAHDSAGNITVSPVTVDYDPTGSACTKDTPSAVVLSALARTVLNPTGAEFAISLDRSYFGVGISGVTKRDGARWNVEGTLTGIPSIGDVEITFVVDGDVYVSASPIVESFTGGKLWGKISPADLGGDTADTNFSDIAPSPTLEGEDRVGAVHTCKMGQKGVPSNVVLKLLPGTSSPWSRALLESMGFDIDAAPAVDITVFIADDGTVRRLIGESEGKQVLSAEVLSWGPTPEMLGPPPDDQVGPFEPTF